MQRQHQDREQEQERGGMARIESQLAELQRKIDALRS
jgi:hypothetical protein